MLEISDIMELYSAGWGELQKREGPRRDRMRPVKWKNLAAQIGETRELLKVVQRCGRHSYIVVTPAQEGLIRHDRQLDGHLAGRVPAAAPGRAPRGHRLRGITSV